MAWGDTLRKRRKAIEAGDATGGAAADKAAGITTRDSEVECSDLESSSARAKCIRERNKRDK